MPTERPTVDQLLQNSMFDEFKAVVTESKYKFCSPFDNFTLVELYHWWQLVGGDVYLELKKQGLIRSTPPILSLPR